MRRSLGGASILSWLPLEVLVKIQAKLSRHHQESGCITVATDEEVSKTLFFQHKRQYYDQNRQELERFSAQSSVMKDDDSIPVDFKFSSSSESISESG